MKKFNLFAVLAVIAVMFVACEPSNKPTQEEVAKMVVKYGDTEMKGGETITVSEANYGEMIAHFSIVNNDARPGKFTVPDGIKAPYSMTKMMTAIIALDYCKPDEIIVVQEDDLQRGSGPKFYDGDKLTMEEALIALMLPSSNTLAKAISRHVGEKILHLRNETTSRKR